jgi:hypothetical protein
LISIVVIYISFILILIHQTVCKDANLVFEDLLPMG